MMDKKEETEKSNKSDHSAKKEAQVSEDNKNTSSSKVEEVSKSSKKKAKLVTISAKEHGEMKEALSLAKENHEKWVRLYAEFENYKKRMVKEKANFMKFALEEMMLDLLQVLDNFERAAQAMIDTDDIKKIKEGMDLIYQHFFDGLKKKGLESIQAKGKIFDPEIHEAIGFIDTDDHPDHTVVTEIQKGYLLNERLLRPSLVQISRTSSPVAEKPLENEEANDQPGKGTGS
ncbi:nucleotide exchange factor GrpE [PVC group bacterium]|nr:nucleotide exchange factor GrpE [PVC group bacterium]